MQMNLLMQLASALMITIAVEFAAYLVLTGKDPATLLICSAAVNVLTNPLLNYLYLFEVHDLFLLEASAVLAESFLVMAILKLSYPQATMLSATANLASLLAGVLIMPVLLRLHPWAV